MRCGWVVLCALLFAAPAGAGTSADVQEVLARLIDADRADVSHTLYHRTAAPFETRMPCVVSRMEPAGRAWAKREWVARLLAVLRPDSLGAVAAEEVVRDPATTASDSNQLAVAFDGPKGAVWLYLSERGELNLCTESEGGELMWSPTREQVQALEPLIAEVIPWDAHLGELFAAIREGDHHGPTWQPHVGVIPTIASKVQPKYPRAAREAGVEGSVMLMLRVSADGRVQETMITQSVPMLDEAAVNAVEQWKLSPAQIQGKPVSVWVAAPVKFSLK